MKIKDVSFLKSAGRIAEFPEYSYPEVAFFGRSNVGKSSLINMIVERKSLVKVGSKPGVTRMINFFILNNRISLADMPGYGYAKLPKSVSEKFLPLIRDYIKSRDNLKLTFLLVDIRRKPEKAEKDLIAFISAEEIPIAVIATKCDKLSKNQRIKNSRMIASELEIDNDSVFFSSSVSGEGKDEIQDLIQEFT